MKDFKMLLEAKNNGVEFLSEDAPTAKDFGFLSYDDNSGSIFGINVDSVKELADFYSVEEDMYEDLFDLEVGESLDMTKDGQGIWLRIW